MSAELTSGEYGDGDSLFASAPVSGYCLGLESSCPPEYANVPTSELFEAMEVAPPPSGSGFESGGLLDVCPPDGSLAGLTDATTRNGGLAELDDDELIGVLRAWRRLESWCSSGSLMAIAELARRRPAERTPPAQPGEFPVQLSEFVGDEVAAALTLTARTADAYLNLALDLAIRLPATAQALHAGVIDYPRARLIADLTRILSDEDARVVEAQILTAAGQQTTGQLRAAVARAVLAVDPEAATRRREQAQRDPRVRRWQEDAGTAALAGFGLPPAEVLEADQRLTDRALTLRDAGVPGSLEELRARAYLDTLLGQDSIPGQHGNPGQGAGLGQDASPDPLDDQSLPSDGQLNNQADPATMPVPTGTLPSAVRSRGRLAARVNLTVPLFTQLGLAAAPGDVAGFGPVDPALARELISLAAADTGSRFCVTVTGPAGQAVGHGCVPGRPPDLGGPAGFTVTISPLAGDRCDHQHQEPGYQPSRKLRHLIEARHSTCCAPGCRRAAARCDLDHTVPYDRGGPTCECNMAPLCRHHHRCKQSEGWRLEQPAPGQLRWTTPSGRTRLTPLTP